MLLVAVLLALAGCSSTTQGRPVPVPAPDYPGYLPDKARQTLAYLDTLRPLDICGYLDRAAVETLGPVSYIGADGEYESCTARYPKNTARHGISKVEVSIGTTPSPGWGTKIDVAGTTVAYNNAGGEFCTASTHFDERQLISWVVFSAVLSKPVDLCAEAVDVATASIPLLKTRPLRIGSTAGNVDTKLARLDSCAAIPAFVAPDQAHKAAVLTYVPWGCGWMADYYKSGSRIAIGYLHAEDTLIAPNSSGEITTEIGGFPARVIPSSMRRYPGHCQLWIGVDAVRPDTEKRRREYDSTARMIELIRISLEQGGCELATQIGTELVRLYKLLP
ncbi:hypothetical protein BOX37_26345 [Nocardia mangyaensis]|uniref:DUF3558 domain-containing protein n=1 Tax=Nocardia mangyaensis TaxID=2213200 RepID=A0A1J0VXT4_9NOCA|nr:hypothetical protein BOX37_26345 [Nocardia mangyaensis]